MEETRVRRVIERGTAEGENTREGEDARESVGGEERVVFHFSSRVSEESEHGTRQE